MVLHLSDDEGDFGVTFDDITKDEPFYTTTSRFVAWVGSFSQERQNLLLPKDDLQDSASWSSSPLVLAHYDWKDTAPPQSHSDTGARVGRSQQDGDVHLNSRRLTLFYFRRLPGFMNPTMCGERTLPTFPPSRLSID